MDKNAIIAEWQNIAKKNFNDEAFSGWMSVTKAYSVFQSSQKPMTEDFYRAQAAILNALLVYHLDLSAAKHNEKFCRSYVDTKIETYLRHLDTLIARSCTLEKTASLEELQRLVKCLLYTRLGDYIMGWLKFMKSELEEQSNQLLLALCAYALALEHALKGSFNDWDTSRAINIIELHLLISKNLGATVHLEDLVEAMSNKKLSSLLCKHTNSTSSKSSLPDVSFIASNVSHRIAGGWRLMPLDMDRLLPLAWTSSLHNNNFFRRFIWILNQEEISEFDHYPFLNGKLSQRFLPYPENLDMPCSPENMSLLDFKVYLFRVCKAVALSSKNSDIVFPWVISSKPTSQQSSVWNSVVALYTGSQLELNQLIGLTNGLEQIRLQSSVPSDKVNLAQTMTYLESVANELTDVNCQKIYMELSERYANAVLIATDGGQSTTRINNLQTKALFPPKTTSVVLDDELADLANVFLAKRLYHAKCYKAAEERLLEVSQRSNQMDIVCKLLASIYDKLAENEQLNLKPKKDEVNGQLVSNMLRPSCRQKDADSNLSFASALSNIQDQPNNISASFGTMISNSQHGIQEMEELNKNILKCIKHNELLIKFINSQSQPVAELSRLEGICDSIPQQTSSQLLDKIPTVGPKVEQQTSSQLLDEIKVKVLENPRKKHQVCNAKFYKNNDAYELQVTVSDKSTQAKLYILGSSFRFQIISRLTVRFINLMYDGKLQKPLFLTCVDPKDYIKLVNVLTQSNHSCQDGY